MSPIALSVAAFHFRFKRPIGRSDRPALPEPEVALDCERRQWAETRELSQALADQDLVGVADALADIVYTAYGTAIASGIDLDEVLAEVHRSNMTKSLVGGEITKGPYYRPPQLAQALRIAGERNG